MKAKLLGSAVVAIVLASPCALAAGPGAPVTPSAPAATMAVAPRVAPAPPTMRSFSLGLGGAGRQVASQSVKTVDPSGATQRTSTFQITPKADASGTATGRSLVMQTNRQTTPDGGALKERTVQFHSVGQNGARSASMSSSALSIDGHLTNKTREVTVGSVKNLGDGATRERAFASGFTLNKTANGFDTTKSTTYNGTRTDAGGTKTTAWTSGSGFRQSGDTWGSSRTRDFNVQRTDARTGNVVNRGYFSEVGKGGIGSSTGTVQRDVHVGTTRIDGATGATTNSGLVFQKDKLADGTTSRSFQLGTSSTPAPAQQPASK